MTGGYEYLAGEEDLDRRHVIHAEWTVKDLARSAVKQDLLYTLGSALTVFSPSRGHAVARLEALLAGKPDPGQSTFTAGLTGLVDASTLSGDVVDEPEILPDIEETARDQIRARVAETFAGHDLTVLVSALLEAEGFTCQASTGGADGGIDVVAGRGLLGMDSPRVIVQVKTGQVGEPAIRDLLGVLTHQKADQGLIVAWGGVSGPARAFLDGQRFKIRLWTAEEVIDAILRTYADLPDKIRAELPLRRVWMVGETDT